MRNKTMRIDVRTYLVNQCENIMLNTLNFKNAQIHVNIRDILQSNEYSEGMQKEKILTLLDNSKKITEEVLTFFEPLQLRDFKCVDC